MIILPKKEGDPLLIAMDYDYTYTADPACMRAVIRCLQSCGHKVYIVTMRSREEDWDEEFEFLNNTYHVETIFCDGRAKRKITEDMGLQFDIWMDDYPEGISQGSQYTKEELERWREEEKAKVA